MGTFLSGYYNRKMTKVEKNVLIYYFINDFLKKKPI